MARIMLGTVTNLSKAQEEAEKDGLIERDEQFQIAVSGVAEEFVTWEEVSLRFGNLFTDATGQRDSDLERPHFTYGAETIVGGPVGLLACVTEWTTNERNETIGCKLGIGVLATDRATKFRGFVHANFQGFGLPRNTFIPEDVGTG